VRVCEGVCGLTNEGLLCRGCVCEGVLQELQSSREKLEDLWSARKLKLDLALQLRVFEQDALEVCSTLFLSFYQFYILIIEDGVVRYINI